MSTSRLSPNFTLHEAMRSQTAARLGIDNMPTSRVIPALEAVAHTLLEPVRAHFGIPFSPSSWYRGPELERALTRRAYQKWASGRGRNPDDEQTWLDYLARKSHPKGEAVDIELPGIPNDQLAAWIRDHLTYDQLILEFHTIGKPESGWVHVSFRASGNRQQVLTIGPGGTRPGLPSYT